MDAGDLKPEDFIEHLKAGRLEPYYLFYGPDEYRIEQVLDRLRDSWEPAASRDFNVETVYADKNLSAGEIIGRAKCLPLMAGRRLIIVRRTEALDPAEAERLVDYLEAPADTSCVVFISGRTSFNTKFYKRFRDNSRAVAFEELRGSGLSAWIRATARELGLNIDARAMEILQEVVGNRLRELREEMEKLKLRHGDSPVGEEQVRESAARSRSFTIFELMNLVSEKKAGQAVSVLGRYLEEGGPMEHLGVLGMLNRQVRLLWQTKSLLREGVREADLPRRLSIKNFAAKKLVKQARNFTEPELEKALFLLYEADGRVKSGSRPALELEALILNLCWGSGHPVDLA
ncbi:MAG: DNA polymerase III subunit delta [Desulfobacteraceae bacterium]